MTELFVARPVGMNMENFSSILNISSWLAPPPVVTPMMVAHFMTLKCQLRAT
jgi:hypothetical protein